jgi:hypothetical protein
MLSGPFVKDGPVGLLAFLAYSARAGRGGILGISFYCLNI